MKVLIDIPGFPFDNGSEIIPIQKVAIEELVQGIVEFMAVVRDLEGMQDYLAESGVNIDGELEKFRRFNAMIDEGYCVGKVIGRYGK